jgi:hypothetical protein
MGRRLAGSLVEAQGFGGRHFDDIVDESYDSCLRRKKRRRI